MKKQIILSALIGFACLSYANTPMPWMQTADVKNINQAIVGIIEKDSLKIPIDFPSFIPDPTGRETYYANYTITQSGYNLYLDLTPNCQEASSCNVYTLNASNVTLGDLATRHNLGGQPVTTTIILDNGTQANYTLGNYRQGFDLDANSRPEISWRANNATYTLTWAGTQDLNQTRKAMVWMVNHLQTFAPPPAGV